MPSMQRVYAFDVDDTMAFGPRPGPIDPKELKKLMDQGHIVGVCGNHHVMMQYWPLWYTVVSFFGGHPPIMPYKPAMLQEIKASIYMATPRVLDYVMVGNTRADALAGLVAPSSNDDGSARLAGWRYIKEIDFANGAR